MCYTFFVSVWELSLPALLLDISCWFYFYTRNRVEPLLCVWYVQAYVLPAAAPPLTTTKTTTTRTRRRWNQEQQPRRASQQVPSRRRRCVVGCCASSPPLLLPISARLCVCLYVYVGMRVCFCVCGVFHMLRFACCSGKPQNTPRANFSIVAVVVVAFLRCAAVA